MTSVCIDGFNMAMPKGSGIATYGRNLGSALVTNGHHLSILYGPAADLRTDNLANLAAVADGPPPRSRINKNERWRRTLMARFGRNAIPVIPTDQVIWSPSTAPPRDARLFWSSQNLFTTANRAFHKYRTITPLTFRERDGVPAPGVVHWTCPLPIHARRTVNLVTFHDLIPLRLPHTTVDDTTAYLDLCRSVANHADHIVVVSEQTRRDVIELLNVDEKRVTNTYQAVQLPREGLISEDDAVLDVEETLGLPWHGYFLYFGAVEPKKNLARIVEAHLTAKTHAPLVIVGGRGWLDADEVSLLDQLQGEATDRAQRIRRFPYMPFPLLISLIRGARGVVFPSLYEGFGLPVLEAMLLGTPVLTSTMGSLPEIAGDAALCVDPYDIAAIRDAIRALDADDGLRRDLVRKGRVQAAKFSPDHYQARLVQMYDRLGLT